MKLLCFRSLWGLENENWETLFKELVDHGYDGIEASLGDIKYNAKTVEHERFFHLLKLYNLKYICGVYTSWIDYDNDWEDKPVDQHLKLYREQLTIAKSLSPFHINAHSGQDSWSEHQIEEFFTGALAIESELNIVVSHETHRGRALYSPWVTVRLIQKFPELKLTCDFSHWVVVCERLLDSQFDNKWLPSIANRCHHIHARIGYSQHAQVPDPMALEYEVAVKRFEMLWKLIWMHQKTTGSEFSTLTPEYGPAPYLQTLPHTNMPVSNLWDICNSQVKRQRKNFEEYFK